MSQKTCFLVCLAVATLQLASAEEPSADRQLFTTIQQLDALGLDVALEGYDSQGQIHLNAAVPDELAVVLPPGIVLNKELDSTGRNRWFYLNPAPEKTEALSLKFSGTDVTIEPLCSGVPGVYVLESKTIIPDDHLKILMGPDENGLKPKILFDSPISLVPEEVALDKCAPGWSLAHTYFYPNSPTGTRSGPIVAVLDTGVDFTHPQLAYENFLSHSVIDEEHNGDSGIHGTAVAGIIGATPYAGSPVAGVCPQAQIMSVRIARSGGFLHEAALVDGLRWAIDHHAEIINLSYTTLAEHSINSEVLAGVLDYAKREGVLIVVSSGTDATSQDRAVSFPYRYTERYENLIVVMGLDANSKPIRGSRQVRSDQIDIAAPGNLITTTLAAHSGVRDNLWVTCTGSSYAAPFVAGTLAALRQHYGDALGWKELLDILVSEMTCQSTHLTGYCIEGRALNLSGLCNLLGGSNLGRDAIPHNRGASDDGRGAGLKTRSQALLLP